MSIQVKFFGPEHQHGFTHNYEPEEKFFMEVDFNGKRVRLDFGEKSASGVPAIRLITEFQEIEAERRGMNSLDIVFVSDKTK